MVANKYMLELTEWDDITEMVEGEARALLERLCVKGPPIDAFALAEALKLSVHIDSELGTRGYSRRRYSRRRYSRRRWGIDTIMVGSKNPGKSERKRFTIAHEIGEVLLAGKVGQDLIEDASNLMAVSLLLPIMWFRKDAETLEFELPALKGRYPTVSHEVIAYRMLDVKPLIATIFDNGRLYRRKSSYPVRVQGTYPLERECLECVSNSGERAILKDDTLCVTGWPVFRDDWKRVILKTELNDFASD
ncbi:MAG: ImmA/IrrE family metallo-endopeptidase [Planctomycetota bacterium]